MTDERYLTVRVLYPKLGFLEDVLTAVRKVAEAARQHEGIVEIGAWLDQESDRIVNVSLWESRDLAMKATGAMHAQFADVPWSEWERQPAENYLGLRRVV